MSRSKWKGPFISEKLLKRKRIKKRLNIWNRNSIIPSYLVGTYVFIHNGKSLIKTDITPERAGSKFGEFVVTRKHTKKTEIKGIKKK